jgi:hypothetical protein
MSLQVTGYVEIRDGCRTSVDELDTESSPANGKNADGTVVPLSEVVD